MNTTQRTTS